jgi:membrane-bound serine protease (ClpP class)
MFPWILLITAFFLLFIEFYLPSGAVLLFSLCLFLYAVYSAYMMYSALYFGFFIGASIVAGMATVWLALHIIKKSASENTWCLSNDQKDLVADCLSDSYLNKTGVSVTPLGPSGIIEIDGLRIQAQSQGTYIDFGKKVSVVKIHGSSCIVKELLENPSNIKKDPIWR